MFLRLPWRDRGGLRSDLLTRSFHHGSGNENRQAQPLQDNFRLYTEMHLGRDKGPHVDHAFQRSGSGNGCSPETQDQVKTGNIEEPFKNGHVFRMSYSG